MEDCFSKASAQIHAKVEGGGILTVAEFTQKRAASQHLLINLEYQVEFLLIAESNKGTIQPFVLLEFAVRTVKSVLVLLSAIGRISVATHWFVQV